MTAKQPHLEAADVRVEVGNARYAQFTELAPVWLRLLTNDIHRQLPETASKSASLLRKQEPGADGCVQSMQLQEIGSMELELMIRRKTELGIPIVPEKARAK